MSFSNQHQNLFRKITILTIALASTCAARAADAPAPAISITSPALPGFDLAKYEYARVIRLADAALKAGPKTIVTAINPRSAGGPHDFSSEGDYWWPDPKNPDAPYIQRDGESNPDNFVAHRQLLMEFSRNVSALAAAYKLTGDQRYATAAVKHLVAWFVNPDTRMNPTLLYSQAIKGRFTGRGTGVIDTLHLAEPAMAIVALRGGAAVPRAAALTPETDAAITAWFRDYLHWMRTHKYGVDEMNAGNNHATCWTLQAATFARVTDDPEALAFCRDRLTQTHIPRQMAPDGSFPAELARTKPYGYSIFNLDVMTALAQAISAPGQNYMTWTMDEPNPRGMVKAVAYLAPYLADKTKWLAEATVKNAKTGETRKIQPDVMYWNEWPVRQPLLIFGAMASGNKDWLTLWQKLNPDNMVEEVQRNYPIRHPVLWFPADTPAAK